MKRKVLDGDFLGRMENAYLYIKTAMNGYFGGGHKAPSYGSTVEFADFREYAPGDDIRRIDWNLYSRFEKYFIRLFVDERQLHNQILIDCSGSMLNGNPEKATTALKIAAVFGFLSVKELDKVSFKLLSGGKCSDLCGKVVGTDNFYAAMEKLENVPFGGDTDIYDSVMNDAETGYSDGLTVIISDFLTESDWKSAVDYITYRKRQVLLVQVLSPDELDPSLDGRLQLMDREGIEAFDERHMKMEINKSMLMAYNDALNDYLDEMKSFCISRGADFISVSSADPIEKILFEKGYETELIR